MSSDVLAVLRALSGRQELPRDWPSDRCAIAVKTLCDRHGLSGWVLRQLGEFDPDQAWYDRAALRTAEKDRRLELLTDLRDFEGAKNSLSTAGILVGSLKGPRLSQRLYGDVGLRASKDIDAFVLPKDFRPALQVLAANGFGVPLDVAQSSDTGFARFQKTRKDVTVVMPNGGELELHFRSVMQAGVSDQINWIEDSGALVMPKPTEAFYLLCHGQATSWFRLKWSVDAATFLERLSDDDWAEVRRLAAASGTHKSLSIALEWLDEVFETQFSRNFGGDPVSGDRMATVIAGLDQATQRMRHRDFILLSNQWRDRFQAVRAHYFDPGPIALTDRAVLPRNSIAFVHIIGSGFARLPKLWRRQG